MIYIVEDDKDVRDGYLMLLNSSGYNCCCFDSAEEFIKEIQIDSDDFLILDLQLTGMDGCSLLKRLLNNRVYIPVIVITAFDNQSYRECCKEYGVLAYLRKPIDGAALIDLLKYNIEDRVKKDKSSLQKNNRSII